ncbi:MAG: type II secretion system secretin GspD [Lentisphaerae bacterium]|nr:type II secretion system secretin GspD [Lentisphaerota bacterium]
MLGLILGLACGLGPHLAWGQADVPAAKPGQNPFAAFAAMTTGTAVKAGQNPFAGFSPVTTATIPLAVTESIALEEEEEPEEQMEAAEAVAAADTNGAALMPAEPESPSMDALVGLKYENMDVEEVLSQYSAWTGLALMRAPDVPAAKITLKCPKRLPKREALLAIEGVLAMHGIALVPMGDKFLKVVPIGAARQQGMATGTGAVEKEIEDTDRLVSRIVELKHLEIAEAQATIQNLIHTYGKVTPLERVNCLMITETALNLKRIQEILAIIDQPVESREELKIFPIIYAKASEIQSKIESIIADVQAKEAQRRTVRPQLTSRMPFQPLQPTQPTQPSQPTTVEVSPSSLERGLIKSKVKMVADDRINSLIVITRPEQFSFFTNIISALDRKIEPEVSIKVFALEYADSKDVVSVLNNLLSGATTKTTTPQPTTPTARTTTPAISPFMPTPTESGASATTTAGAGEIQLSGKLSSDVKIIADTRINSLLVLASRVDMAVIEDVLRQLDIMLSQVLIEVAIIEIGLSDKIRVGIDWLQRSMIAYNEKRSGGRKAVVGFGGASRAGTEGSLADADAINMISDLPAAQGSGLTYYFKLFDYNIDAVINMLASASEAKILSTPIILTMDNKQAKIMVGEKRPIVTSTSISGGGVQQSAYQYTDIGIQLDVTPRINKKGFVNMDIKQKIDNTGEDVIIDGNAVPIITTRDFTASIAVNDGRTIVIGGIVTTEKKKGRTKIPFLGDIPLLGVLFRSDSAGETRRELIVLMTPYVLNTPEKAYAETARRHGYITAASNMLAESWSGSALSTPNAAAEQELKKQQDALEPEGKLAPPGSAKSLDINVVLESPTGGVQNVPITVREQTAPSMPPKDSP